MKRKELEKNISITKSNQLSTASYYLTSEEQRLILACIGQINPMDPNGVDPLKKYIVTAEEFKELFKNDKNVNIYQILKKVSDKLYNRSLTIENGNEIIKSRWVSEVGYAKNEGYISLIFAPLVVDHICRLKKNFNSYRLSNIQKMDSIYGLRIYELIMSLEGTSYKRNFKIDDLKKMLGIESKYKMFADFHRKVLLPAQNDINLYSDINLDWELVKNGRKVESVKLVFKEKPDAEKPKNSLKLKTSEKNTKDSKTFNENTNLEEWIEDDLEFH
jgi:plasmid replication initiation protein